MEKFDFNTIEDFDNHINKSVPNYDFLIEAIKSISDYYVTDDGAIYDIGCSTGKLLKELPYKCPKIGYDNSNLLPKNVGIDSSMGNLIFKYMDLTDNPSFANAQIIYSIFTLQFINPSKRFKLLKDIYNGLNDGGVFIMAEKIYQENGKLQEVLTFSHYDYKAKNFSSEEIFKKERDLRLIMKPKTLEENYIDLQILGYKHITTFYQAFNFIGLIAIK